MEEVAKWYALQTQPMYEKSVMRRLLMLIETGNYPDIKDIKMITQTVNKEAKNRKGETIIKEVEEKLYPCYLFVKMVYNPTVITMIRLLQGVSRWVGEGYTPIPLSDSEVLDIPQLVDFDSSKFSVGDNVRICSGPLEGFSGKVIEFDETKKQFIIECLIFGRHQQINVEIAQLERI